MVGMDGEGRPKLLMLLSFGRRRAKGLGSATMRGEITRSRPPAKVGCRGLRSRPERGVRTLNGPEGGGGGSGNLLGATRTGEPGDSVMVQLRIPGAVSRAEPCTTLAHYRAR